MSPFYTGVAKCTDGFEMGIFEGLHTIWGSLASGCSSEMVPVGVSASECEHKTQAAHLKLMTTAVFQEQRKFMWPLTKKHFC